MTEKKTSKSQMRATNNWRKKNPDQAKYGSYRSTARTFARHWATKEDMDELIEIFNKENENSK